MSHSRDSMSTKDAEMIVQFVRSLMKGRMVVGEMTFRQVSALCQVSSPTVCRFLQGRAIDAITFLKFCEWIKP